MKKFFVDFWNWFWYDLCDRPILCIRKDWGTDDDFQAPELKPKWCSPEYMNYKTGIDLGKCRMFLIGPELSEEFALPMNKALRKKFNSSNLTASGEFRDIGFREFVVDSLNLRTGESLNPCTGESLQKQKILNNVLDNKNPITGEPI